jgi:hypothetical protein
MMEGIPMPIIQQQFGYASLETADAYVAQIAPKRAIETIRSREEPPSSEWGGADGSANHFCLGHRHISGLDTSVRSVDTINTK